MDFKKALSRNTFRQVIASIIVLIGISIGIYMVKVQSLSNILAVISLACSIGGAIYFSILEYKREKLVKHLEEKR